MATNLETQSPPVRRKPAADLRNVQLVLKVTEAEKKQIEDLALENGYAVVSEFCRRRLLGFS